MTDDVIEDLRRSAARQQIYDMAAKLHARARFEEQLEQDRRKVSWHQHTAEAERVANSGNELTR